MSAPEYALVRLNRERANWYMHALWECPECAALVSDDRAKAAHSAWHAAQLADRDTQLDLMRTVGALSRKLDEQGKLLAAIEERKLVGGRTAARRGE